MKRKVLSLLVIITLVLSCVGCGTKKLTVDSFTSTMEGYNFKVVDLKENNSSISGGALNIMYAYDESGEDPTIMSFVVFDTEENAQTYFDNLVSDLEQTNEDNYDETEDNLVTKQFTKGNYEKYMTSNNFNGTTLIKIDETVLVGQAYESKKKMNEYIEALGY